MLRQIRSLQGESLLSQLWGTVCTGGQFIPVSSFGFGEFFGQFTQTTEPNAQDME